MTKTLTCPVCGIKFDPADRAGPTTLPGAMAQIKYCSERCARKSENRRYYLRHRREVIRRNLRNQRKQKRGAK